MIANIVLIILIIVFLQSFMDGYRNKKIDLDNVPLFTITEYEEHSYTNPISNITGGLTLGDDIDVSEYDIDLSIKKEKKKSPNVKAAQKFNSTPSPSRNSRGYTELQQDCFDALKSLGIKSVREREYLVSKTFNDHQPKSLQEFLSLALSRG
jgi:hypothetical protein